MALDKITTGLIADDAITSDQLGVGAIAGSDLAADVIEVIPHIKLGTLYPSYVASGTSNKLLDGTTAHDGAFGTAQADGRKYYYTNIDGSKPIKDPRIGSHFGSQRHPTTSLQVLEYGADERFVYSVDGRDWIRVSGTAQPAHGVDANGTHITTNTADKAFLEITGYFSDANILMYPEFNGGIGVNKATVKVSLNGGSLGAEIGVGTSNQPIIGRHVNAGSLHNINVNPTLGINTLHIEHSQVSSPAPPKIYGIELIVQDTTSTANKSKVQIPAQNVVSHGKKFTVAATAHHYNPFAFAGDGTTAVNIGNTNAHGKVATGWTGSTSAHFDSTLDTATSLGLDAWVTGGNYYRPVNGGRVVRWVDSTGAIKTSVNMMPPCATAMTAGSDASLPTSHAWTTVFQPKIKSGAIDNSQSEVAKTFHIREFGNGSANGNASYADCSTVNGGDDLAYVMDDGLTSFSGASGGANEMAGHGNAAGNGVYIATNARAMFVTFIGTGLTGGINNTSDTTRKSSWTNVAQNLPYGTHILKLTRTSTSASTIHIDGVQVFSGSVPYFNIRELTFHQPKMPPIPEDAVIISDYMLMADFVKQDAAEYSQVSKGVRHVSGSRDIFYVSPSGYGALTTFPAQSTSHYGYMGFQSNAITAAKLPSFCTSAILWAESTGSSGFSLTLGGTSQTLSALDCSSSSDNDAFSMGTVTLGNNLIAGTIPTGGFKFFGYDVASPIHTSSHYQTFETPHLHELVGGDRNLEQTNLVVAPDGKTWDEVTRDTSYMGNLLVTAATATASTSSTGVQIWTLHRGNRYAYRNYGTKDFVWAYNVFICLKEGTYNIHAQAINSGNSSGESVNIRLNGEFILRSHHGTSNHDTASSTISVTMRRGDQIMCSGKYYGGEDYGLFQIHKN